MDRRPPPSRLSGLLCVGADFFARRGALARSEEARPRGVVDRAEDLAHAGIDVARLQPAVVAFLERTADLELAIDSRWRSPLRLLWPVARPFFRWIGQFVLPLRHARVLTSVHALAPGVDGRPSARAIVRRYDSGQVFQVVAYATWEDGGTRYMSAAFPMPFGQVLGILRLDPLEADASGRFAAALTSAPRHGDAAGIWFVLGWPGRAHVAFRAPLAERLELRDAGAGDETPPLAGATVAGRHEQRLFGVRFVTHHYAMRPRAAPPLLGGNGS